MDEDPASPVAGPSGLSNTSGPSNSSGPSADTSGTDSNGNFHQMMAAPLPQYCLPTEDQVINL